MVKASTLLEVIIAMVIILIVFTLAIGIYNHVLGSTPSVRQQQVKTMTDGLILRSINEEDWTDQEIMQDSIVLKKTVLPYEKYTDLLLITVTAFQREQQVGESRRVVKRKGHE